MNPVPSQKMKYCTMGMVSKEILIEKGIAPSAAKSLAKFANHGLSQSTWSSYKTVANHLERCSRETGVDMSLPFNTEKNSVICCLDD